eukprot:CAMPEP_0167779680 /NCGR_PEP_ID=MMETSP0111_2-20121227/4940_1 /TAXON_ID=91324 /ORGANISM="Lotharella globosa, Strain CCCM811" /LENGTH=343 /DNA_ID=CAMNT_0007670115 /DNA_START=1 /DNA_END=1032 /DNA_ORIENTATION=-
MLAHHDTLHMQPKMDAAMEPIIQPIDALRLPPAKVVGSLIHVRARRVMLCKLLSKTIFGRVWYAKMIDFKVPFRVALKISVVPVDRSSYLEDPKAEIDTMRHLGCLNPVRCHKNVLRCFGSESLPVPGDKAHYINITALELASFGDLYSWVIPKCGFRTREKKRGSEVSAATVLKGILEGVDSIHEQGVAHLDLSLENILMVRAKKAITPKICDFGMAQSFSKTNPSLCFSGGSPGKERYMAPEVKAKKVFNPILADAYSIGVIAFILFTGYPPYEKPSKEDRRFVLATEQGERGLRHLLKCFGCKLSDETIGLLVGLMAPCERRFDIKTALRHSFFGSSAER